MKATFLIILLLAFLGGVAQVKKDTSSNLLYYIDSVRTNSVSDISPDDISGIMIVRVKDSVNKIIKGTVYISSKKHPYHFMTIGELTKRVIPNLDTNTQQVIYFVDDKLVTDTTGMKFETDGHVLGIDVIDGSQIKAFKGLIPHVIVLKISSNEPIYLRGNAAPALFKQ